MELIGYNNLKCRLLNVIKDVNGHFLIVHINIGQQELLLVNVYLPCTNAAPTLSKLLLEMNPLKVKMTIVGGDFNLTLNSCIDRSTQMMNETKQEDLALKELMECEGLYDAWRNLNPLKKAFTFHSGAHNSSSRIDYFLCSKSVIQQMTMADLGNIHISDHAPISIEVKLEINDPLPRRPWRLNTWLLRRDDFTNQIRKEVKEFINLNKDSVCSSLTLWCSLKAYIRGRCIAFSSHINKKQREKLEKLEKDLGEVEDMANTLGEDSETKGKADTLRKEIRSIYDENAEKKLFYWRHKYWDQGEKSGKLLAYKIKKEESARKIFSLVNDESKEIFSDILICEEFRSFYSTLYGPSDYNVGKFESFMNRVEISLLPDEGFDCLQEDITLGEVLVAISKTNKGKSPGPDGLPIEIYACLADEISGLLVTVFNEICSESIIPAEMKESIITLIHKEGRDPKRCSNYRPISLINCDMKLLTKIWAERLKKYMKNLVGKEQSGFIEGRGVYNNTRTLKDLMQIVSREEDPTVLVSLDAEKAFDNVCWPYLFDLLRKLNFPGKFVDTLKKVYSKSKAKILVNGRLSENFELFRGTKQGCPLSPYLFNLCIEQLAKAIKNDNEIKGVCVGKTEYKHLLYADDLLLMLRSPNVSIPALLNIISQFASFSGYKLNQDKSVVMEIKCRGDSNGIDRSLLSWTSNPVKYLGMMYPNDYKEMASLNITKLRESLEEEEQRLRSIELGLWAKVNVVKMNWLPKILFVLNNMHEIQPASVYNMLDRLIWRFLWNGRKAMVSQKRMEVNTMDGGFGLPIIRLYQKAFVLKGVLDHLTKSEEESSLWVDLERSTLRLSNHDITTYLLGVGIRNIKYELSTICSGRKVICDLKRKDKKLFYHLGDINLWCNPCILVGGKTVKWDVWIDSGVCKVNQLLQKGNIIPFSVLRSVYNLPMNELWNYLRLRTALLFYNEDRVDAAENDEVQIFAELLCRSKTRWLSMSEIYKMLKPDNFRFLGNTREVWNDELGSDLSEQEWRTMIRAAMRTNINLQDRLRQQKIFLRLHWTPKKMYDLGLIDSPRCWRCNDLLGNYSHMICECRIVKRWWDMICDKLASWCGVQITATKESILFNDVESMGDLGAASSILVRKGISVGLRMVMRCWKSQEDFTLAKWMAEMHKLSSMERRTYEERGRLSFYEYIWKGFLDVD